MIVRHLFNWSKTKTWWVVDKNHINVHIPIGVTYTEHEDNGKMIGIYFFRLDWHIAWWKQ